MRIVTFFALAVPFMALTFPAVAVERQSLSRWGSVNMQGTIIDTTCAIATESRDQTIDLGIIPLSEIQRSGEGRSRPFTIELEHCVLEKSNSQIADWQYFSVTFDGSEIHGLFAVLGNVSGVGLKITDSLGNVATPGRPLPTNRIVTDNLKLHFNLQLVKNSLKLTSGEFNTSIRFKLDYF